MNQANEVRPRLDHLSHLAEKYNCAVLVIMHLSKMTTATAQDRVLGSVDFVAAARSVLIVGRDPEDPERRIMSQSKASNTKEGDSIAYRINGTNGVVIEGYTDLKADDIVGSGRSVTEKTDNALEEAKDFLEDVLKGGKQSSKDIYDTAAQYGISKRTLQRAKEEMNLDCREREGFGKDTVVYWKLPYSIKFEKQEKVTQESNVITLFDNDSKPSPQDTL